MNTERFGFSVGLSDLRRFFDNGKIIGPETRMTVKPNGLILSGLSPADIIMIHETMTGGRLEDMEFAGDQHEGITIGVSLQQVSGALGALGGGGGGGDGAGVVDVSYDPEASGLGPDALTLESGGMRFNVGTIDPHYTRKPPDRSDIPELPIRVMAEGGRLKRSIRAAGVTSDYVTLSASADGGLRFSNTGGGGSGPVVSGEERPGGDMTDTIPADELLPGSKIPHDAQTSVTLTYAKEALRAVANTDTVKIDFADEYPVSFRSEWGDDVSGRVRYVVSPRIIP